MPKSAEDQSPEKDLFSMTIEKPNKSAFLALEITDWDKIPPDTTIVHLNQDTVIQPFILELLMYFPKIKEIEVSRSNRNFISQESLKLLKEHQITLRIVEGPWRHRPKKA